MKEIVPERILVRNTCRKVALAAELSWIAQEKEKRLLGRANKAISNNLQGMSQEKMDPMWPRSLGELFYCLTGPRCALDKNT